MSLLRAGASRQNGDDQRQLEFECRRERAHRLAIRMQDDAVVSLRERVEDAAEAAVLVARGGEFRIAGGDHLQGRLGIDPDDVLEAGAAGGEIAEPWGARDPERAGDGGRATGEVDENDLLASGDQRAGDADCFRRRIDFRRGPHHEERARRAAFAAGENVIDHGVERFEHRSDFVASLFD